MKMLPNIFSYIIFFLLLIVSLISCTKTSLKKDSSVNLDTLRLVQVISRHGDRAPNMPFPTDPYKNSTVYTINGWGELTEIGAKQVYELGSYLRRRYDGYLPRRYHKKDFYMMSSDIDRAIMSGEANLAALFGLGRTLPYRDLFKEWQPVPIHIIPKKEDNLLYGHAPCPRYDRLSQEYIDSDSVKNFHEENQEFIDFILEMAGLPKNITFRLIFLVQDTLECQKLHNLTLPTWLNDTVFEKLDDLRGQSFTWDTGTDDLKRLKAGPLLGQLVEEMRAKVEYADLNLEDESNDVRIETYEDGLPYRKMYAYSGHDTTIVDILHSLNLFYPLPPTYAAAIILELHKEPETDKFYVEIFYRNDTTREPYKLDLTPLGCDQSEKCSFETFSNFLQKYIPSDWNSECQLQPESVLKLGASSANNSNLNVSSRHKWTMSNGNKMFPEKGMKSVSMLLIAVAAIAGLVASMALIFGLFQLIMYSFRRNSLNSKYEYV